MARGLRSLVHHPIRASGVGRSGADALPTLSTPFTKKWDGETVAAVPSDTSTPTDGGDGPAIVSVSADGHSRACRFSKSANGSKGFIDLGEAYDLTAGFRLQILNDCSSGKHNHEFMFSSQNTYYWDPNLANRHCCWVRHWQGNNPDTLRFLSSIYGSVTDTGDVSLGGERTDNGFQYSRYEVNPSGNLTMYLINVNGAQLQTGTVGCGPIPQGLRYLGGAGASGWFDSDWAEIWLADISVAWPTPGVPQA